MPTATSFRFDPSRAVSRTSAPFKGAGILTRMLALCVLLAAKVLALYTVRFFAPGQRPVGLRQTVKRAAPGSSPTCPSSTGRGCCASSRARRAARACAPRARLSRLAVPAPRRCSLLPEVTAGRLGQVRNRALAPRGRLRLPDVALRCLNLLLRCHVSPPESARGGLPLPRVRQTLVRQGCSASSRSCRRTKSMRCTTVIQAVAARM